MSFNLIDRYLIDCFDEEHDFLSNFAQCNITMDNLTYASVEHAYQAAKSYDRTYRLSIAALPHHRAGKAKRLGSKRGMKKAGIRLREDWDRVKVDIMTMLLKQKFTQEPFRSKLIKTVGCKLIEGNTWHDNYWGDCECTTCEAIPGKNILGQRIVQVRNQINAPGGMI